MLSVPTFSDNAFGDFLPAAHKVQIVGEAVIWKTIGLHQSCQLF